MALTNYLVQLPIYNEVIVEIDAEKELNERVRVGDSNDDGENVREFDNTRREVEFYRSRVLLRNDRI